MSTVVLETQWYLNEFVTNGSSSTADESSVICHFFSIDCFRRNTSGAHNSHSPLAISTAYSALNTQVNCTPPGGPSTPYHLCSSPYNVTNGSSTQGTNDEDSFIQECIPLSLDDADLPSDGILEMGMAICTIVGVVGGVGNLITMATFMHQLSLPLRLRNFKTLTADLVLIFNLALCDLCYCVISLPFMFMTYSAVYYRQQPWIDQPYVCGLSAFFRYTTAICEWTTLGLLAFERCMCIHNYRRSAGPSRWFSPLRTIGYCVTMWVVSVCMQLPTLLGVYGSFGFNSLTFKCDFCRTGYEIIPPRMLFFALESLVPCVLIFFAYMAILCQVFNSSQRLIGLSTKRTQTAMGLRKSRTIRMILGVLFVYLICVIPMCLYNVVCYSNMQKGTGVILYCLYWVQYMANNFIYVVSNNKHRNAYCQLGQFLRCAPIRPPLDVLRHRQLQQYQRNLQVKPGLDGPRGSTQFLPPGVDPSRIRTPSDCEAAAAEAKLQKELRPSLLFDVSYHPHHNLANTLAHAHCHAGYSPSEDSSSLSTCTNISQVDLLDLSKTYKRSFSFHSNLRRAKKKLMRTFSA